MPRRGAADLRTFGDEPRNRTQTHTHTPHASIGFARLQGTSDRTKQCRCARFAKQTPVNAGECKGHWQVDPRWQLTAVMHGTPHVELGVIEVLVMSRRAGETKLNLVSESTMSNSIERSTKGNPDNYPASSLQFPDVTRRLVLS